MSPSPACVALVKSFEGFRAAPYMDAAGIPTIGYGHTRGVSLKDAPISEARAVELLQSDLQSAEVRVKRYTLTPLAQHQYDALCSFAFNTKEIPFRDSTLVRLVNLRDFTGAAKEFDRWVFSNGKRLRGLVLRRKAERRMFEGLDWRV